MTAFFDKDIETRSRADQREADTVLYARQIEYVMARSPFYRRKFADAGVKTAA